MSTRIPNVDTYLSNGCGRCKYFMTPNCKVHKWQDELLLLRKIALESGLHEEIKWGMPTYTYKNKNIFLIFAFKEYCAISFFKGVLLQDNANLLQKQGEYSQSVRIIKFTQLDSILNHRLALGKYISEAIDIEILQHEIIFDKKSDPLPVELTTRLERDTQFSKAFSSLSKGKQRAYILYFSQPKQSETRNKRIDSKIQDIMNGIGMNDKFKSKNK